MSNRELVQRAFRDDGEADERDDGTLKGYPDVRPRYELSDLLRHPTGN